MFLVSCCTLGALKHDVVAFVSFTLAAERCLQLPQQVKGVSLVLGERGRCNLECRDLSTQTARRREAGDTALNASVSVASQASWELRTPLPLGDPASLAAM